MPDRLDARLEAAPQFERIGDVSAERLAEDIAWTSSGGDLLTGRAGDWAVSDGIDRWTVADGVFRATYVAAGDGRWRKAARVRAVRVDERVEVMTLEGRAVAEAGDWVVRNPSGESWPVPAKVFARTYREV